MQCSSGSGVCGVQDDIQHQVASLLDAFAKLLRDRYGDERVSIVAAALVVKVKEAD